MSPKEFFNTLHPFHALGGIAAMIGTFRGKGAHVGSWPRPEHDAWEAFMQMQRQRLQEHAQGKMARALGYALPGESQEVLDRIAAEDGRLAQEGMVQLKSGQRIYYKHIDELTREDRTDRIAAERATVEWLKERGERGEDAPPIPSQLL